MDGKEVYRVKKGDRFEKAYKQGTLEGMEIWIDRVTGVNYLVYFSGYKGALRPFWTEKGS